MATWITTHTLHSRLLLIVCDESNEHTPRPVPKTTIRSDGSDVMIFMCSSSNWRWSAAEAGRRERAAARLQPCGNSVRSVGWLRRPLRAVAAATSRTNIFPMSNDEVRSVAGQRDGHVENELSAADKTQRWAPTDTRPGPLFTFCISTACDFRYCGLARRSPTVVISGWFSHGPFCHGNTPGSPQQQNRWFGSAVAYFLATQLAELVQSCQ